MSDSAMDPSEREFGRGTRCRPTGSRPAGSSSGSPRTWLLGEVKRMHYFGEELVMFRTASGSGATCSTRTAFTSAANMGVGGTVDGETHRLPLARLAVGGDGTNALIPYSKIGCKQNVRVKYLPLPGVVRIHRRVARTPRSCRRTGGHRYCPTSDGRGTRLAAAPALPDAQPGQGARADDHRERGRPVSRAVRAPGRQRGHHTSF